MQANDLDWIALLPGTNLYYLTGVSFHSTERTLIGLFPAEGTPMMVMPTLEQPKIIDEAPFEIEYFLWDDGQGPVDAFTAAVDKLGGTGITVGVEALFMRFQELELFRNLAAGAKLTTADEALTFARAKKDDAEIALMRKAVEITENALENALTKVKPGMTEREISKEVELAILSEGGNLNFALVQGGETTTQPHSEGGDRKVQVGDPLLFDWGAAYRGYTADITRTFVVGTDPDPKLSEIYELTKAANQAGREACAPGVPAQEVDRATRKVIEDGGFGEFFIHRTGHGLGLDVHEDPYIVEGNETPLEVGNVFTVEPGLYVPGVGGVRVEDNVVVTEDGSESLTTIDREMRVIG